jgi:hypothetical protein
MEFDDLIGLNTLGLVGLLGIQPSETEIVFGPDDENPGHEGGRPPYDLPGEREADGGGH